MASILRFSKLNFRYFTGLARNIIFNTTKEVEGSLVQSNQCLCSSINSGFSTVAPKQDQSLERSLKRIDQDVRRSGRISRRDIEEVLEEIRHQRTATSSQSLLVIRCCGNLVPEELPEVRTTLVQEIWKTLNNLKVPMDISHYNALLRVYLENEHEFSPTEFLSDLESQGIEPNRVTYQRLIARYCQLGDIEGATRILEFMREKQLPVNENVFNALIMGHSQADDMESAAGIIAVMQQASLEPSADTYTTLLCGYARKGDIDSIQSTLVICDQKEIFLLDKDFLDVIYSLTTNGHGDKVDPIVERLRKSAGYNQDAVNVILRLINKGFEDISLKLLKTMPRGVRADGDLTDVGNFFIKQMVKSGRPTESILKICQDLQSSGLNSKPLLVAIESGLTYGLVDLTLPLLKEAKNTNYPIRQHYFWPLICSSKSNEDVVNILAQMKNEYDISPSSETIREYVIPNLKVKSNEEIITLLHDAGVSYSTASTCTVFHVLSKNQLKEAADIASSHRAYYSPNIYRKFLIGALAKTQDFDSYIRLVRQIHDSIQRSDLLQQNSRVAPEEDEEGLPIPVSDDTSVAITQKEVLGQIINDAVNYYRKNRIENMTKILTGFVDEGLSISNGQAEKIQENFGSEFTAEISTLLGKLASGDLEPKVLDNSDSGRRQNTMLTQMSYEQLEKLIQTIESKEGNAKGVKRYLLANAMKKKDLLKTEEILQRLDGEGYLLTTGVKAQLIDLYVHHEKLDEALQLLSKIRTAEPDFILDNIKTIKLVTLLVKSEQFGDAQKILDDHKKVSDEKSEEMTFNYKTTCWRLLNNLAEAGKEKELTEIFESLITNNYIDINNVMLGPLVKVHIVNNNLQQAVDKFEEICNKHQTTPWKNELACKLIQAEDAVNLQRLTDLSTNIHGEVNSLYDLVFSFVECGRIRQARKILETPGLRHRPQRLNNACERYHQEGMTQSLEGLMEATKDLNHIDRNDIFYNLLLSYCKENEPEKALGLWTKLQEENIAPTENFLKKLGEFLESKNLEVPFIIPKEIEIETPPIRQTKQQQPQPTQQKQAAKVNRNNEKESLIAATAATSEGIMSLRKALRVGDVDTALIAKQNLKDTDKLNVTDQSLLIESLIKNERLNEATKIVTEMLQNQQFPVPRIFRFFLNKLAVVGDYQKLEEISQSLSPEVKKIVSIDNRICHANIVAGKSEDYLRKLETDLENAKTDQEITDIAEKFPRGGSVGILEKNPEIADQFERMAEKYAAKGIIGPMNVLWVHHFISENTDSCNRIWDKHLAAAPRLMFQRIVHLAREKQDERLIQRLIDLLKHAKVSEGAIGNAYSCLLDVYAHKEQYDNGLIALDSAVKDVCLENINRTALVRIKIGVEKSGKDFPHKIPEKSMKNGEESSESSSSSSSSDDDKKSKKDEK